MTSQTIDLPPILDLVAASELLDQIRECVDIPLEVDASGVTRLGTHCAQILLAASQTWEEQNVAFNLNNPSEGFLAALALIGLEPGQMGGAGKADA